MKAPVGAMHRSTTHESAVGHVTGKALYVDDLPEPAGLLFGAIVPSPVAAGRVVRRDDSAALAVPGVVAVFFAEDLEGDPLIGPISHDEPVLALDHVHFHGQAVGFVVAESRAAAQAGAAAVSLDIEATPALVDLQAAIEAESFSTIPHVIARGDVASALQSAPVVVEGTVHSGAQDHFYLEPQAAMAVPDGEGGLVVHSSTQHPTELQRMVGHALGLGAHQVVCRVPRMGGGFGGKESQSTNYGVLAALGAQHTGRPVKVALERDEDMRWTGNRHPFFSRYRAGFARDGRLLALEVDTFSDGGWVVDLSGPVMDRALFHLDNAYHVPDLRFTGRVARTNLPSNTAFRGFGGPQGVVVVEDAIEKGAAALGLDPVDVRIASYYREGRDTTPYGQHVPAPRLERITATLLKSASYRERRAAIESHNASTRFRKRGIGFQPVKFGISFTASLLNQAGALVLVYSDGTVQVNHGGTEMGQGLHTKMVAVCADTLGVAVASVRVMTTSTDKVPNTSATAASSGSDLNGAAVVAAAETVRERMRPVAAEMLGCAPDAVSFLAGQACAGGASVPFASVAHLCWVRQISLSATGFYATPGIAYDAGAGRGTPFFYFAYGAAVSEVELDGRTGEHRVRRVDIVHDVGNSLIPSIDLGQIEGAFVQGMGWLTTEQVLTDDTGRLVTVGPSTYKIPSSGDAPIDFRVALDRPDPQEGVVGGSKAVGEPPFLLAISVHHALRHAVAGFGPGEATLAMPATHEALLRAVVAAQGG
jgi:xanthine dehydrogenase large subunit